LIASAGSNLLSVYVSSARHLRRRAVRVMVMMAMDQASHMLKIAKKIKRCQNKSALNKSALVESVPPAS